MEGRLACAQAEFHRDAPMAIDEHTKRRLLIGFLTTWISKLASSIIQFAQVPVLLTHWSRAANGEWIALSAIPSWLSFSNVGFGSVAGNEMTMLMARGEQEASLAVFQSCWWLISASLGVTILVMSAALSMAPVADWLHLTSISNADARWIIFWLGLAVLLSQLEQLLQSAYRCIARYSYGNFLKSALSLLAFGCSLVPVFLGYGPRSTAKVLALANIAGTLILCWTVKRDIPWISYGWSHARWAEILRLTRPAFGFMGFPLGNALNIQGTVLAVQYAMGAEATLVFGIARTVSRVALQIVQMVNNTAWPELSIAFGSGNMALVRTLHRHACQIALLMSLSAVVVMAAAGPTFMHHWTRGQVPPSQGLVSLLLVVVVFYSLWSTSSTLVQAINKHERLATVYTCATGLTVLITFFAARAYGLYGAAGSLLVSEIIMDIYVLPSSLRISSDTWGGFLGSLFDLPRFGRGGSPSTGVKPDLDLS